MEFDVEILDNLENFKEFLKTKPSKEVLQAVNSHLEGFLSDAYDHIDPEEYEVAFEEETGISYRDATEEEFDEWFITNVLCFEDLSEICKILRSLLEAKDLDKALENFNKKAIKGF